jgi:hypothetical protein
MGERGESIGDACPVEEVAKDIIAEQRRRRQQDRGGQHRWHQEEARADRRPFDACHQRMREARDEEDRDREPPVRRAARSSCKKDRSNGKRRGVEPRGPDGDLGTGSQISPLDRRASASSARVAGAHLGPTQRVR